MFEARNIMSTNVLSTTVDTDIYEAIRVMVENNVTGLPVVDAEGVLVGIVSEKDVLDLLCNTKDRPDTVSHYMSTNIVTFDVNDSLVDIAECLNTHYFRRVPILSKGRLVGIISRKDIITYILKLRHQDRHPVQTGARA